MENNYWIEILIGVLTLIVGAIGLGGDTWDKTRDKIYKKITIWGWTIVVLLVIISSLSIYRTTIENNKIQTEKNQENESIKADTQALFSELPMIQLAFYNALKYPQLRNKDYANQLLIMVEEFEKKFNRYHGILTPEARILAERMLSQQKVALMELNQETFTMAQAQQYILNAFRTTDEFAMKFLKDSESNGLYLSDHYYLINGYKNSEKDEIIINVE